MKKLILLSALLIFACSSDDSSDSNNISNEKLIESITVISGNCQNTHNLWLDYDNDNRITSFQIQYVETNCDGEVGSNSDIENGQLEYNENSILISSINETFSIPIDQNGLLDDVNTTFVNGYLISDNTSSLFGGNCDVTRLWDNNNLIEANFNYCIDDNSVKKVLCEYNENLNPIRFYWNDWHIWFGTVIELTGVFGKESKNLLSKSTRLYDDDNDNSIDREEIYNYYYQLDEDGYPSVINIITTYSNSMIERSVTYQLTYTN
tara:strand:+ start:825 stop:1616 length:792 start_codon:yes stop_codon:yes gene_type:complete